jgi:ATP-dependent DNA helicase PIF1
VSPDVNKQIAHAWKNKDNWTTTDVLIIDEISMISGELFTTLEKLARQIRSNNMPFGGIQLILAGT